MKKIINKHLHIVMYICSILVLLLVVSCRKDAIIYTSSQKDVDPGYKNSPLLGFYLLNEGNMGMNRATIDFYDFRAGQYHTDIFSERNPTIVKELGDVGNDIQIYGSKCYAVINCSNYIEVFDAYTGIHIKEIEVPNCRYMTFHGNKAYVSSYSGPVAIDPNAEIGFVAEIDTTTLELQRKVTVGYQPDEIVVKDNKLYCANSGGYRVPDYDTTVSVVDLESFKVIKTIDVAINLHRLELDHYGNLYVSSRGDYYKVAPNLYVIDTETDTVKKKLDIPVSEMTLSGDSLYYYSVAWSYNTGSNTVNYGIYDTKLQEVVNDHIITDGTDQEIMIPYGIAVNPINKDVYITDAQNYVVTGYVYCFSKEGKKKWSVEAGNIPAHFAFLYKQP